MKNPIFLIIFLLFNMNIKGQNKEYNKLSPEEEHIILNKGTEKPFTGKFEKHSEEGIYICKQCGVELYKSDTKFESNCGWPSFDDEIKGAITRIPDPDGRRTEITCSNCGGHLGHVFKGEHYTSKNTRHCVNSISIDFKPAVIQVNSINHQEVAYFASGCFWGTQYHFQKQEGVISTEVGYMGGSVPNPSYELVCMGNTGHAETLKVVFDPEKTSFETLAKLYFETHDPSQLNRQGPDIGTQYRSAVFCTNSQQKETIQKLSDYLKANSVNVVTEIIDAQEFFKADAHHQNYYENKGGSPYCHIYKKKF